MGGSPHETSLSLLELPLSGWDIIAAGIQVNLHHIANIMSATMDAFRYAHLFLLGPDVAVWCCSVPHVRMQ